MQKVPQRPDPEGGRRAETLAERSGYWDLSTLRLQVFPPKRLTDSAVFTARKQAGLEVGLLEPSRLVGDGHDEGLMQRLPDLFDGNDNEAKIYGHK